MYGRIRKADQYNVYERLILARDDGRYMDAAAMAAGFSPIFPEEPKWEEVIAHHLDAVADLAVEGLEVFGMAMDGECVALCGYRMLSDEQVIVHDRGFELPYEMFIMVDDCIDISEDMTHAAQLFIASREDLKIMQLAT